jgi:predicted DNA-binding protein (MmcQ/YjbR family)
MIERLRKICMALPDATETTNFDHPFFRVKNKPFCVFHGAIAFKVLKTEQNIFLEDPRFFKTPYMHHHGWVSLHAERKLDWREIAELVQASYELTARPPRKR